MKKNNLTNDNNLSLEKQIENLFISERRKYLAFIKQRVSNQIEAEDILQDVFTSLLTTISQQNKTHTIDNIPSWIFTALRNRIIDTYRKKRAATFSNLKFPGDDNDNFDYFIGDTSQCPEMSLLRKTIWEAVQNGLKTLPEEQRIVFERNEFEGISFKEMALETGVNINTLLARKRYAVLHLRKYLKEIYELVK